MLADPQSVTINTVAISLPRTGTTANGGTFRSADGLVGLTVSHSRQGKRTRHLIKLDHAKIAADPLLAGVNVKANVTTHLVIDVPETGYTATEAKQVVDGLTALLTASSGAIITKALGNES